MKEQSDERTEWTGGKTDCLLDVWLEIYVRFTTTKKILFPSFNHKKRVHVN